MRVLPRGRHGLARTVVEESQRVRLLEAIIETVAESGYTATTLSDIVRAAGISRKTFYEHFESKQACFATAFQAKLDRHEEESLIAAGQCDNWYDALCAGAEAFVRFFVEEPAYARVWERSVLAASEDLLKLSYAGDEQIIGLLRVTHGRIQATGLGPTTVNEDLYWAIAGAVTEVTRHAMRANDLSVLAPMIVGLVSMLLTFPIPLTDVKESQLAAIHATLVHTA
ncbi:MAG: TetR family transcriptional regulator [Thermoleophilaceae bacterium]|nr:TetR family transcriptional regulator [Thermoleophilaceae bacterium]